MFKSNISFAEEQLLSYLPKTGKYYEANRNYSEDRSNNNTTSLLSPFIRYRLISEEQVLEEVLKKYDLRECEKFIQEIYWRTYWKGWLEHRPSVYSDYLEDRNKLIEEFGNKKFYLNAISGNTNLSFFNNWVNNLKENGYLHNHVRMWFASIWIFTLNLPWQLGADFFMQHLLDGDPASNTLSWRWVAGIHTKGKNYLARKSNIEKYSNIKISSNEILNETLRIGKEKGYKPQIYTHPLGTYGHSAGTTIGMWDSQGGVPFNGDFPMNYNTVYAIELNTKVFIEEWNKEIRVMLEEAGTFEETGFRYVNGRQTKLILIGDQRVHLGN